MKQEDIMARLIAELDTLFDEEIAQGVHLHNEYCQANNYQVIEFFDAEDFLNSFDGNAYDIVKRCLSSKHFALDDPYLTIDVNDNFLTSDDPYHDGWFDRTEAIAKWILDNDVDVSEYIDEFWKEQD